MRPLLIGRCVEHRATVHKKGGYGKVGRDGRTFYTHRLAYESVFGPIPSGLIVRHKCDNPKCINPAHLEPGTHADNRRDAQLRGRLRSGLDNHSTRVTPELTRLLLTTPGTVYDLAARFGVSKSAVSKCRRGETAISREVRLELGIAA